MSSPVFYLADVVVMPPSQLVAEPLDFSLWTITGTGVVTMGQADPFGGTGAGLIDDDNGAGYEYIASPVLLFGSSGTKAFGFYLKAGTATAQDITVSYTGKPQPYCRVRVTWTDDVPTVTQIVEAGAEMVVVYAPLSVGGGWFRVVFVVPNIDATASTNVITLHPATYVSAAMTGTVYLYCANTWDVPIAMPRQLTAGLSARTLRFANRGFVTGPADTPVNTYYDARLKQPSTLSRDAWSPSRTGGPSKPGYGDLVLLNGDGALDYLAYCGVDGRAVTLWRSEARDPTYPTDFTSMLIGTAEGMEVTSDVVTLKLRDRQAEADVPLQVTKYAGDNSLPDGLEGIADDIKGKPKPLAFGKALNVPAVQVNTSKLIFQLHDGALNSVDAVYDRGVRLAGNIWEQKVLADTGWSANNILWACEGDDGTLVIAGRDQPGGGPPGVAYSTDGGETWVASDVTGFAALTDRTGCAFGNGKYIVCCGDDVFLSDDPAGPWTNVASGWSTLPLGAKFANGVFLVWGYNGSGAQELHTSADGSVWAIQTFTGFQASASACYDIGFGAGVWVAVGDSGRTAYSNDNGVAWVSGAAVGGGTQPLKRIAYAAGGGGFLSVGGGGASATGVIVRSVDGVTWQDDVVVPTGNNYLQALAYGIGVWWAGGAYGGDVIFSPDGVNWSKVGNIFASQSINYAMFSKYHEYFLLVGDTALVFMDTGVLDTYGSEASLLADANTPEPGAVISYAAGGYIRLGSPPDGDITADITQGAATANRTAGQIFTLAMNAQQIGPAGDFSAWTKNGVTVTGGQDDPDGSSAAYVVDASAGTSDTVFVTCAAVASDGEKLCEVQIRKGTSTRTLFALRDQTTGINEGGLKVEWNDAVPVAVPDSAYGALVGTIYPPIDLGGGWYSVRWTVKEVIAANPHAMYWYVDRVLGTGTIYGYRAHVFDGVRGVNMSDVSALDTAAPYECGFWTGEETTVAALCDQIAESVGAWWGVDKDGAFRIQQLLAPSGSADASFTAADLLRPLERVVPNDVEHRIPSHKIIVRWGRVYLVQEDVAGAATEPHRNLVANEWRETVAVNAAVQSQYLLSPQLEANTLLAATADAATEAARLLALRGVQRDTFRLVVPLNSVTATLDFGSVVSLTHARYGLAGGRVFVVLGVSPDVAGNRVTLTVWG